MAKRAKNKTTASPSPAVKRQRVAWPPLLLLIALVGLVYGRAVGHEFLNYDDNTLVYENPHVNTGLSGANIVWAFSEEHGSNWVPLTWISHMIDCQLFGIQPWWPHLVNVLLHAANVLLLFLFLRSFAAAGPSLFAACLFAIHPIHIESVAWVAERKDVLSTLFWLLSCHAYLRYAQRPAPRRYAAVAAMLALGLLSKPMVVTLPCVLLLLDYWPLGRLRIGSWQAQGTPLRGAPASLGRLLLEKLPLFGLVVASAAATLLAQRAGGAVATTDNFPLDQRLLNALISYLVYPSKLLWPQGLAIYHPHAREAVAVVLALVSLAILVTVTVLVGRRLRSHGYLAVGWLWYLGALVPVIGIIQVGAQSHAYRYTYVPFMGLYLALAAGLPPLIGGRLPRRLWQVGAAALIGLLAVLSWIHVGRWHDNESVYTYCLAVTGPNHRVHNNLAVHYMGLHRHAEALPHLERAVELWPSYRDAHWNLGKTLWVLGRPEEGIAPLQRAVKLSGNGGWAVRKDLANCLFQAGHYEESLAQYEHLLTTRPNAADILLNAAVVSVRVGQFEKGVDFAQRAIAQQPGVDDHLIVLGTAYSALKEHDKVIELLDRPLAVTGAVRVTQARLLASAFQAKDQDERALAAALAGLEVAPDTPALLEVAAFIEYARLKEYPAAYKHFRRLLAVNPQQHNRAEIETVLRFLEGRGVNAETAP